MVFPVELSEQLVRCYKGSHTLGPKDLNTFNPFLQVNLGNYLLPQLSQVLRFPTLTYKLVEQLAKGQYRLKEAKRMAMRPEDIRLGSYAKLTHLQGFSVPTEKNQVCLRFAT